MKANKMFIFFRENKVIVMTIVLWLLISYTMHQAYDIEWKDAMKQHNDVIEEGTVLKNGTEDIITLDAQKISQEIVVDHDKMTGFSLYINGDNKNFEGILKTELIDEKTGICIQEWEYDFRIIKGEGYFDYELEHPIEFADKSHKFIINLNVKNRSEFSPRLVLVRKGKGSNTRLWINGKLRDKIIPYRIADGDCSSLKFFFLALYIGMTLLMYTICFVVVKKKCIERIFTIAVMLLGMIYMFVLPPFTVPDELVHFGTTYAYSSEVLGEEAMNDAGEVLMPSKEMYGAEKIVVSKERYIWFMKGILGRNSTDLGEKISTEPPLKQNGLCYFPQIVGVTIARLLAMNPYQILFAGRIFALLFYAFLMFWAVRLIPFGKMTLFIIGILPMTLQQVVSYNYDSLLFGVSFFVIAYLLYLKYEKEKVTWFDCAVLVPIVILISLIKFVYLPLIGLALFIPKEKFGGIRKKSIMGGCMVVTAAVTSLVAKLGDMKSMAETALETAGHEGVKMSLDYCMENFGEIMIIFYRTIERQLSNFISQMLASPLGWLEVELPTVIVIALILLLLLSMLQNEGEKQYYVADVRYYSLFASVLISVLVMTALLLGWTTVGENQISGIQGRYFLPILPLAIVLLRNNTIILKKNIDQYLFICMGYVQCMTLYFVTLTGIAQ